MTLTSVSAVRNAVGVLSRMGWRGRQLRWIETDAEGEAKTEVVEVTGMTKEEYNAKYKEYQEELHAYRLRIKEEMEQKKLEKEEKKKTQIDAKSEKEGEKGKRSPEEIKQHKIKHLRRQLAEQEASKQRKESNFKRESLRREMLRKAEDDRYAALLEQSRTWITEDMLDNKITLALDNAKTLY